MITDRARSYARRMDALAADLYGEAYTLKVTHWNDGDFRIVAYNVKDTDHPEHVFDELWYQDQQHEPDDAAMRIKTMSREADVPRDNTEQFQRGQGEWVDLPDDPTETEPANSNV